MSTSFERFLWMVFGMTGSGKTYLVEQFLGAFTRPIVIPDVLAEWGEYGRQYQNPEGLLRDVGACLNGELEWPPGGIFVLKAFEVAAVEELFEKAHRWRVPGTYLVDELHMFAPSNKRTSFLEMIRTGRHARQSIVGITQRPQAVHNHAVEESAITTFQLAGRAAEYIANDSLGIMPPGIESAHVQPKDVKPERGLKKQQYRNGGKWTQLPFAECLGDADGSVWHFEEETREVVKLTEGPKTRA